MRFIFILIPFSLFFSCSYKCVIGNLFYGENDSITLGHKLMYVYSDENNDKQDRKIFYSVICSVQGPHLFKVSELKKGHLESEQIFFIKQKNCRPFGKESATLIPLFSHKFLEGHISDIMPMESSQKDDLMIMGKDIVLTIKGSTKKAALINYTRITNQLTRDPCEIILLFSDNQPYWNGNVTEFCSRIGDELFTITIISSSIRERYYRIIRRKDKKYIVPLCVIDYFNIGDSASMEWNDSSMCINNCELNVVVNTVKQNDSLSNLEYIQINHNSILYVDPSLRENPLFDMDEMFYLMDYKKKYEIPSQITPRNKLNNRIVN